MDFVAVLAGFVFMVACWVLLVKSMRINGRPMWWRHFAAASFSPLTFVGGLLIVGSLLGVTDPDGETWGFAGVIAGLLVVLPVSITLGVSWGAAKRKQLNSPAGGNEQEAAARTQPETQAKTNLKPATETKIAPEPVPESEPKPEPALDPLPDPTPEPESKPELATKPAQDSRTNSPVSPTATGNVRFIYRDAEGNESTRELTNFKLTNGKVRGFCLDSQAIRTFRLDRIDSFLEGESQLYATEAGPARRHEAPEAVRSGDPEITFSGFDAKTRASLEKTAKSHGFVVRKSVTKNLDYFVIGQRRSASKLAEAEDKPGCSVIDKEGFLWLLATGETSN